MKTKDRIALKCIGTKVKVAVVKISNLGLLRPLVIKVGV